jgi:acetyl esterase
MADPPVRLSLWFVAVLALAAGAAQAQQGQTPEERFRRLDRDGDGRLSREELRAPRLFDAMDANGDGFVTLDEERAFRAAGQARPGASEQARRPSLPDPDFADVPYGTHERNRFDLWRAEGDGPRPLVIFYHGGGFRSGDKRSISPRLLDGLRRRGISVAAANYRLTDTAPFPAQMLDAARALQFIRLHAAEYGIDPTRVGATGGSAGAGISEWLAFHDDLADPKSDDPVARQSTRLNCIAVTAAQTSYDPRFMQELFGSTDVEGAMYAFYGMTGPKDIDDPRFHPLFEEASPINHATADDPPVMLYYPQANDPLPPNPPGRLFIHHPKFGFALKEKLDRLGVECILKLREDYPAGTAAAGYVEDAVRFFTEKLAPGG